MSTPSRIRRTLGVTGGSLAAVGLLAGPAAAWFDGGSHATGTSRSDHRVQSAAAEHDDHALTPAEFQTRLDSTLDRVAAKLAADEAQWSAVPAGTVLSREQRKAAAKDLAWSLSTRGKLGAVPTSGLYAASTEQQARLTELRSRLDALVTQLHTLLANEPAAAPVAPPVAPSEDSTSESRDSSTEDAEHEDGDEQGEDEQDDEDGDDADHEDGDREDAEHDGDHEDDHEDDGDEHEDARS